MARILRPRARRRNRSRIYTIVSLVIIVVIIAYIYIPIGSNHSDSNGAGLMTNSNTTTIPSDYGTSTDQQNSSNASDTGDASMQGTTPEWKTSTDGETSNPQGTQAQGTQPDKIDNTNSTMQPTGVGSVTTSMRQAPPSGNSEADKLIADATALLRGGAGSVLAARDKLNDALRSRTISNQQIKFVKDKLSGLADDWLFNRIAVPGDKLCEHYKVQTGDQLRIIGDKHKVPYEFLMEINKIKDPRSLKAGETIKVVNGPFNAKVYRSTFTMDLYLKNTYVRSFKVGLGVAGSETPTGLWRVAAGGKLIEPEWTDPSGHTYRPTDPDYPLGSRWIALEGLEGAAKGRQGFAIHGTHQPESLGTASSQGCIRLENGNAILVYNMLIPIYSTVEVLD